MTEILACDVHGPLKRREGSPVWVCLGWDGEGCPSAGWPMPDDAYQRVVSGHTRWPGAVRIVSLTSRTSNLLNSGRPEYLLTARSF